MQNLKNDTGIAVRPQKDSESYNVFPQFEKPQPVGYFSIVGGQCRNYEPNAQQLHYFKQPPIKSFPLDLNVGLSQAIKKPATFVDEHIDHLLKFIFDHPERLNTTNQMGNVEFICLRGLLRILMCTPYEHRQDWRIHVTRYRGSFYLSKRETEQEKSQALNETERQKTMAAWGFKFEQYCLTDNPFTEPNPSVPVDECSEFLCVFRACIGGNSLLFGAEMDGIISEQPVMLDDNPNLLPNLNFIELKTRQATLNPNQWNTYNRHKTRNWWCQSFLVGINDIYVGMRSDTGLVQKIERLEVRSLHTQGKKFWTAASCANFLKKFLSFLKELMADVNCPDTVYDFYFNANSSRITYDIIKGKSEHSFLPDWYVDMLQRTPAAKGF